MSVKYLVALVFALVIGPASCSLVQAANSEDTKGDSNSKTNELLAPYLDSKALAPNFYKERYKPNGWTWTFIGVINRLHCNILLLGLVIYPVLGLIVVSIMEGKFAFPKYDSEWTEALYIYFCLPYGVVLIVSLLASGVSYLMIGLFSDNENFVLWDFISFSLHAFIQCGLIIVCLTMLANWIAGRQVISIPTHNPTPSRIRWVLASMLKAAIVTILTGAATTIGGWIGGGIIFVITTGIAAAFGINVAHAQEAK